MLVEEMLYNRNTKEKAKNALGLIIELRQTSCEEIETLQWV
jgi:hypothetical protein